MHIPDGFLDVKVWAPLAVISGAAVAYSAKKISTSNDEMRVPLTGISAAFVFAAQMLNFPVAGGTSGHFMGAFLVGTLLGPFSAIIVLSSVLIVQCFLFQDGGFTALGANIFNMGLMGILPLLFIKTVKSQSVGSEMSINTVGLFIGAWVSIVFASIACSIELWLSGTIDLKQVLIAMVGIHSLIGIGEALVTVTVIKAIAHARIDLLNMEKI